MSEERQQLPHGAYVHVDRDEQVIVCIREVNSSAAFEHHGDDHTIESAEINDNVSFCLSFTGELKLGIDGPAREVTGNIYFQDPDTAVNTLQAILQLVLDKKGLMAMGSTFGQEIIRMDLEATDPFIMSSFLEARLEAMLGEEPDVPEDH